MSLYGMARGCLRDREVIVQYAGGKCRKGTSKGCIQGYIAGPNFWNLILEFLIREPGELLYVQAFADDVFLVISGQSTSSIVGVPTGRDVASESWDREDHIYISVIEPIVLYVSCAWAPVTRKLGVQKILNAVQRSVALKACQAHRTVSLHSATILSRLLPLDIRIRETV
ncbi:hypothetical protein EVAR_67497_1 [Eumeta japonica]|uniref:115 kDa protein in type-1 retrotransposable element R1DM n=1 Tax=Eumeta variegata TaxID=151549 RepID=A0A4C1ZIL7_EUMVA|nr:hypothetical protein EVAR_67497_1 [Eumeta japonica]